MPASADELVALLDIESLDVDLFRGRQPETDRQRVFGGQVAAQALIAGIRTVPEDRHVHSLHSYFLRPGDTLVVTRIDRLARSMRDLQNIVHELREKGAYLKARSSRSIRRPPLARRSSICSASLLNSSA